MMEKIKSITRGQAIIFGFILILVIGTLIFLKVSNGNSLKSYKKFQDELVAAAENYKEIKKIDVKENGEKRITLSSLKKQNLVTNPLKDKCKGYVIISNEETYPDEFELIYKAYIKCGSRYKTDAYVEY